MKYYLYGNNIDEVEKYQKAFIAKIQAIISKNQYRIGGLKIFTLMMEIHLFL